MITVKMEKECGCFKRSDNESMKTFENRDDALIYAQKLCADMNETFCKKHGFSVIESAENEMTIQVAMSD
jgi:hypothetical protein